MKQVIFFNFLLLPILLLATNSQERDIKAKVNFENNINNIKFMIQPPVSHKRHEKNDIYHITARYTDKIILDISASNHLNNTLLIKHKLKNINLSNSIKYIITDNQANKQEFLIKTKTSGFQKPKLTKATSIEKPYAADYRKLKPKVWKAMSVQKAIIELYGDVKEPIPNKIKLLGPETTYCHINIPIHILSDIDLESFAIFNDKTAYPTVAIFSIPTDSIIDFKFKINMKYCTKYSLVVIGKDRYGNFYKTTTNGQTACADGCGGGG